MDETQTVDDAPATPSRDTIGIKDAAKVLGIGKSAAYEAAKRGEIPTIRIGRKLLVPKSWLEQTLGRS